MLDRVKEALFSILEGYGPIRGRVLDLYAGTGSLGIECLSRGAEFGDFVEQNAHVCTIIADNLRHTKFDQISKIHTMPVERFLQTHRGVKHYAIIVMDPPYADPQIERMLALVAEVGVGAPGALLVIGHSPRVVLADAYPGLTRIKWRQIGDSCFSIYELDE